MLASYSRPRTTRGRSRRGCCHCGWITSSCSISELIRSPLPPARSWRCSFPFLVGRHFSAGYRACIIQIENTGGGEGSMTRGTPTIRWSLSFQRGKEEVSSDGVRLESAKPIVQLSPKLHGQSLWLLFFFFHGLYFRPSVARPAIGCLWLREWWIRLLFKTRMTGRHRHFKEVPGNLPPGAQRKKPKGKSMSVCRS